MAKPKRANIPGNKVIATVKSVKGNCSWGHEAGDTFEISCHDTAGLCGFFYHDIFPYIVMLQFGGGFPATWGNPDVLTVECMDRTNLVTLELRHVREQKIIPAKSRIWDPELIIISGSSS